MKIVPVCCLLALLPLAGCASFHPVTASPLEVGQKYRTNMIAYTQRMQNASASEEERGWILYERAGLFLTLGMLDYARSDYRTIIYLPRGSVSRQLQAHAFQESAWANILAGSWIDAAQMLDSSQELGLANARSHFIRAVLTYYTGRRGRALEEIGKYRSMAPEDRKGVMWGCLAAASASSDAIKDSCTMPPEADTAEAAALNGGKALPTALDVFAGKVSPDGLLKAIEEATPEPQDNVRRAELLSEAYYYLGKYYELREKPDEALSCFRLSAAQNVFDSAEHGLAVLELRLHGDTIVRDAD